MAKNNTIYEEILKVVVESCRNEDGFDWEVYQQFCDSGENNLWYEDN